ncbi:hypothetical protein ACFWIQ_24390 [Kitasatospora sp. NPDC127059]|uniref:hypothetical protein n=1 Tax=unclassified Kitasatospora TaxID=2633591 RepID=UPI00365331DA
MPTGSRRPRRGRSSTAGLDPGTDFTASQLARPDEASAIELGFPHDVLAGDRRRAVTHGDMKVETRR